jgi:thiol-disulfide isomerase/thioredoxin
MRIRGSLLLLGALCSCSASSQPHGSLTSMSLASRSDWKACRHQVPDEVCVLCHPERAAGFKQRGDWCKEHDVPESQCLKCHPDLDFSPPHAPPAGADVVEIAKEGQELKELGPHLAQGKVTVFDFYAAWCPPCRKVDEHLYPQLSKREDIAIRKVNVGNWESDTAQRWLSDVPELPHLIVYDKRGKKVRAISGAQLSEIDAAIGEASR